MAFKLGPNPFPWPQIKDEELLDKPMMLPGYEYDWDRHVPPYQRLYLKNTMASMRQKSALKHPCAPKDSLDIMLNTVYNHCVDGFGPKPEIFVQPETLGLPGHRLLKNVRVIPERRPAKDLVEDDEATNLPDSEFSIPGYKWQGIKFGGISEKRDPFGVKLGISSEHGSQSNRGYSRKVDGSYYSQ